MNLQHKRKTLPAAIVLALTAVPGLADTAGYALEEIIVTAQKRVESLQDVPIAISAFEGDFLDRANITNISDIAAHTPGFSSSAANPVSPQIFMRGIGTDDFGIASDPSVGLFIDGVYYGRAGGAITDLEDVQRIEVLKGPQGTLFGRNTIGGAISITTERPSDEVEGSVSVKLGKYDNKSISATFNTPIVEDKLHVRGSVKKTRQGGWQSNLQDGRDDGANTNNASGRLSLTWMPTEVVDVTLKNNWSRTDENFGYQKALNVMGQDSVASANAVLQGFAAAAGYAPQTIDAVALDPINFDLGRADTAVAGGPSVFDRHLRGHSVRIDWNLNENYELTSVSAYRDYTLTTAEPSGLSLDVFSTRAASEEVETYSQELRLNASFDTIEWFIGLSAFREDSAISTEATARISDPFIASLIGAVWGVPFDVFYTLDETSTASNRTDSYAAFGDTTWDLTEDWSLSLGLRYTYDKKAFGLNNPGFVGVELDSNPDLAASGILVWENLGVVFPSNLDGVGEPVVDKQQDNWENLSGRVVLSHDFSEDIQSYFSVAQGYKSGGFNTVPGVNPATFEISNAAFAPEEVISYELGIKSSLLDSRLRVNAALFQYEYSDLQVVSEDPSSLAAVILNAGQATGTGLELDIAYLATENLQLSASMAWLEAEYDQFRISDSVNLKGQELNRAPTFSGSLGLDYNIAIEMPGEVRLTANYSYTGEQRYTPTLGSDVIADDSKLAIEGAYGLVSGKISYISENQDWEVSLWGTNLTDEQYLAERGTPAAAFGFVYGRMGAPRMYGAEVKYSY